VKFGLVVYKQTDNIGDDILSYAGSRFLPQIDYVIDREQLDVFVPDQQEQVSAIMNGWFLYQKSHWPPSPYINPLFVGIHFSDNQSYGITDEYLDGKGREYLKKYAPIGCRDNSTLKKMEKREIPADFSGCMTLTLSPFSDVEYHGKYILVDVSNDVYEKVVQEVGAEQVEVVTHNIVPDQGEKSWKERSELVETFLKRYQGAKAVITTRLHCALPCLALGTPVLLLIEDNEDTRSRIGTYREYVHNCSPSEFLNDEFDWKHSFQNPKNHLELREKLIQRCQNFISQAQSKSQSDELQEIPDLQDFRRFWRDQTVWQRSLASQDVVCMNKKEQEELLSALDWMKDQISCKDQRIEELEQAVSELDEGKKWLEGHVKELEDWIQELEKGKQWLEEHAKEQEAYIKKLTEES